MNIDSKCHKLLNLHAAGSYMLALERTKPFVKMKSQIEFLKIEIYKYGT